MTTTIIIQGASRITIEDATPETLAKPEPLPSLPAIGAPWPGIDGIYAGIVGAEGNHGDSHLVMLNARATGRLNHSNALQWAESLQAGSRLPTKKEGALLFANLRAELAEERWIWLQPQSSASTAWYQLFYYGNQGYDDLEAKGGVRAVLRLPL